MKKSFLGVLVVLIFLAMISCGMAEEAKGLKVTWVDENGSVIATAQYERKEDIPLRELPADGSTYYYKEWSEKAKNNDITYTLIKADKTRVEWYGFNGKVSQSLYVRPNEVIEFKEIFDGNETWRTESWKRIEHDNVVSFVPIMTPNSEYLKGNFCILRTFDISGNLIATVTGVVYDEDGNFIADGTAFEGACTASAEFVGTGKNNTNETAVVYLAKEYDENSGVMIGKVFYYNTLKASEYYNELGVTSSESGQVSYLVSLDTTGKINATPVLNIISSSTNISSIQVNTNLDIVGMVNDSGKVIATSEQIDSIRTNGSDKVEKFLADIFAKDQSMLSRLVRNLKTMSNVKVSVDDNNVLVYKLSTGNTVDGVKTTISVTVSMDGTIEYYSKVVDTIGNKTTYTVTSHIGGNLVNYSIDFKSVQSGEEITYVNDQLNMDTGKPITNEEVIKAIEEANEYVKSLYETIVESKIDGIATFYVYYNGKEISDLGLNCEYAKIVNGVWISHYYKSVFPDYMKWSNEENSFMITGEASLTEDFENVSSCVITFEKNVNEKGSSQNFDVSIDLSLLNTEWPEEIYARWTVLGKNGEIINIVMSSFSCWN